MKPSRAPRLHRSANFSQHFERLIELVVGVENHHDIQTTGQLRIGGGAQNRLHLRQLFFAGALLEKLDVARQNLSGINRPARADLPRQTRREPTATGADVGDHAALFDLQGAKNGGQLQRFFAVGILKFERATRPSGRACLRSTLAASGTDADFFSPLELGAHRFIGGGLSVERDATGQGKRERQKKKPAFSWRV